MGQSRQHYYPAALIGQFGPPGQDGPARDRHVWVARRSAPRVFRSAAAKSGLLPREPRLYDDPANSRRPDALDDLWRVSEDQLGRILTFLDGVAETDELPARLFVEILAPFVAHLVVRHPRIVLPSGPSALSTAADSQSEEVRRRVSAFACLVDTLIYGRQWLLLECPDGLDLVSSDAGWQWLPGRSPGEIFVPISRTRAIIVRGGRSPYTHLVNWVSIPTVRWDRADIHLRRDLIMATAPHEVYAASQSDAERAVSLWANPQEADPRIHGVLDIWANSPDLVWLVLFGAHNDPTQSWARFLTATHRFSCTCTEAIRSQSVNRSQRREHERHHQRILRSALRDVSHEAAERTDLAESAYAVPWCAEVADDRNTDSTIDASLPVE
jgi:hypothetical protein